MKKFILILVAILVSNYSINIYSQSIKKEIKSGVNESADINNTFKQIKIEEKISDSLILRLIPKANKIAVKVLLNNITHKYLILGVEFLDDSSEIVAKSSIIKVADPHSDGYFEIDSLNYLFSYLDEKSLEKQRAKIRKSPMIKDTVKFIGNIERPLTKSKKEVEISNSDKVGRKIRYDYTKEKLLGKYFSDGTSFTYQHSSWKKMNKAKEVVNNLILRGIKAFYYPIEPKKGMGIWYRVRIGPYKSTSELDSLTEKLR